MLPWRSARRARARPRRRPRRSRAGRSPSASAPAPARRPCALRRYSSENIRPRSLSTSSFAPIVPQRAPPGRRLCPTRQRLRRGSDALAHRSSTPHAHAAPQGYINCHLAARQQTREESFGASTGSAGTGEGAFRAGAVVRRTVGTGSAAAQRSDAIRRPSRRPTRRRARCPRRGGARRLDRRLGERAGSERDGATARMPCGRHRR